MARDYSQKFVLLDVANLLEDICFLSTRRLICAVGGMLSCICHLLIYKFTPFFF